MLFIVNIPVILLTAYAAWTDIKRKEIDNWVSAFILSYAVLVDAFLNRQRFIESFISMFIVITVLMLVYYVSKGGFGGGDIKLLSALAFYFGSNIIPLMFVACLIGLIYGLIKGIKEKTYFKTETVFAPAIFAATVLTVPLMKGFLS